MEGWMLEKMEESGVDAEMGLCGQKGTEEAFAVR